MIPKKLTVGKKIAVRSYLDRNRTELSERVYTPQKAWFKPYGMEVDFLREKKRVSASNYSTTRTLQTLPTEELRDRPFSFHRYQVHKLETNLIWKAFDTPELIGIFLHDLCIQLRTMNPCNGVMRNEDNDHHDPHSNHNNISGGDRGGYHYYFDVYGEYFLRKAFQYTMESRYWRCLGITKPFFDPHTLRAHCWEDNGLQVGTLVLSSAMRHALMDLERAARRKELGLDPNYVWDKWGPMGFVDGSRIDYLPRFAHNPYRDPDGVEVSELDILPFNTHRAIKERYGEFIFPDLDMFTGVFRAPTHGGLSTLEDIPNTEVANLFRRLHPPPSPPSHPGGGGAASTPSPQALDKVEGKTSQEGGRGSSDSSRPSSWLPSYLSPLDLRILMYLSAALTATGGRAGGAGGSGNMNAFPGSAMESSSLESSPQQWWSLAAAATSWEEVRQGMAPVMEANDEKIDAARFLQNSRHHPDRVRAFFEEKCGFQDFMNTPDKMITGAVLAYLLELQRLCRETSWGAPLARALTDAEKAKVMGYASFIVYRHLEDAIIDKKRKAWVARFSGEANEEHTLDYLLENFGRRVGSTSTTATGSSSCPAANVGTAGEEFDREQEPIGRQVQRRVLDSDKANKLAEVRKSKGKMWSKKKSVFDSLHQKQMQNFNYGVR